MPPNYLQNKVYPAKFDRLLIESMFGGVEQVSGSADLAVSAVSGYTISVASGRAVVNGDITIDGIDSGMYHLCKTSSEQKTITPHATLPRIDRVVYKVHDSTEVGSGADSAAIEIVAGTPTSGANLTNETGIAAVPSNAISLAKILVDASGGSISAGDIEDDRVIGGVVASNSAYKMLMVSPSITVVADKANGTYLFSHKELLPTSGNVNINADAREDPDRIYLNGGDYAVSGLTAKLRLRAQVGVNGTVPAITFTFGLYPLAYSGGSDILTYTAGTVVAGSTAAVSSPSANTPTPVAGSDFNFPAAGVYCFGVVLSAQLPANARVDFSAQLQVRNT